MSKRRSRTPTFTTPTAELQHYLKTAELAEVVPRLDTRVLQRVVSILGLEDAGDVLVNASPEQLLTLLDADVWTPAGAMHAGTLDAARFGVWLRVLVEADVAAAARQLQALDPDLIVGLFAQHMGVCSRTAAELRGLQESAPTLEYGGLVVWARRDDAWDAIATLLAEAQTEHPRWFGALVRGCRDLSYEHLEEASGFDDLAGRREQAVHDMATARDLRREALGYVTPAAARAFLAAARRGADADPRVLRGELAHYRHALSPQLDSRSSTEQPTLQPDTRGGTQTKSVDSADVTTVSTLVEACEGRQTPRGLLGEARQASAPASRVGLHLAALATNAPAQFESWQEELGFLANALLEGGVLPSSRSTHADAVSAAIATCDLGLERLDAAASGAPLPATPVDAFSVGWAILHREVCSAVAAALLGALRHIPLDSSVVHDDVRRLRGVLQRSLERERPWEAGASLEVVAILDLPAWAVLTGLLAEYPVVPMGCLTTEAPAKRLRVTTDVEFIASERHLAWVRAFCAGLTQALS